MQPTMMQPLTAVGTQTIESRVALLESVLKPVNNTITLQVGTTKVVISQNKIELVCQGAINIKGLKVDLESQTDMDIRVGANLTERASASLSVEASGTLTLKGAVINQN